MLTTNTHECYLALRHWPTRDPYLSYSLVIASSNALNRSHIDCSAIVNDQLSALELAITPNMGHGWASDVALSNIHERYLFTWLFHFI